VSRPAWNEVLLEVARAITDRRHQFAFDQLSDFLRDAASQDERREALAMRATVLTHLGDAESAQRDLELAHSLSRPAEYSRYTIELLLARAARDRGDLETARRLYSQALRTALDGNGFSAGTALEGIMRLAEDPGTAEEEQGLIREAIEASWLTLGLETPMPTEVGECIRRILSTERGE
jgi:tetratricopeptide (TPR) repeat protein